MNFKLLSRIYGLALAGASLVGMMYLIIIAAFGGGDVVAHFNAFNELWIELPLLALGLVCFFYNFAFFAQRCDSENNNQVQK